MKVILRIMEKIGVRKYEFIVEEWFLPVLSNDGTNLLVFSRLVSASEKMGIEIQMHM